MKRFGQFLIRFLVAGVTSVYQPASTLVEDEQDRLTFDDSKHADLNPLRIVEFRLPRERRIGKPALVLKGSEPHAKSTLLDNLATRCEASDTIGLPGLQTPS